MTTIQYVLAVAFALLTFVAMANLLVDLYVRGVVRAAVDEGARAGGRLEAGVAACQRRAADVLDDLLGGALRDQVEVTCEMGFEVVTARGEANLAGWVPGLDWGFAVEAASYAEREP